MAASLLVVALAVGVLPLTGTPTASAVEGAATASGHWTFTDAPIVPRKWHAGAVLDGPACRGEEAPAWCGEVLIVGGVTPDKSIGLDVAELYDPDSESTEPAPSMPSRQGEHVAAVLLDGPECHGDEPHPPHCGQVLATGGSPNQTTTQMYDPATDTWASATPWAPQTFGDPVTLTLLDGPSCAPRCGHVLLTVHNFLGSANPEDAYVYDPAADTWQPTPPMPRASASGPNQRTTTVLTGTADKCGVHCGKVLVFGGDALEQPMFYNPAAGAWEPAPPPPARFRLNVCSQHAKCQAGIQLDSGEVLVAGVIDEDERDRNRRVALMFDPDGGPAGEGEWRETEELNRAMWGPDLVGLTDGRVLAAGAGQHTEIYDPAKEAWQATGTPGVSRGGGLMLGLPDGTVLDHGGDAADSAERFDPSLEVRPPSIRRVTPAAGSEDGGTRVIIEGAGFGGDPTVAFGEVTERQAHADEFGRLEVATPPAEEVLAPPAEAGVVPLTVTTEEGSSPAVSQARFTYTKEGVWQAVPDAPVTPHAAVPLAGSPCEDGQAPVWCGQVLAMGDGQTAAVYDSDGDAWTATEGLGRRRFGGSFTGLPDGGVLAAGGAESQSSSAAASATGEVYTPQAGSWTATGDQMATPRQDHTATRLDSGQVLVAGGRQKDRLHGDLDPESLDTVELYDSAADSFNTTEPLVQRRWGHQAVRLADGRVLVAGGRTDDRAAWKTLRSAEVFDPATGQWSLTGELGRARAGHTMTLLDGSGCAGDSPTAWCGRVLAVGGEGSDPTAEVYDPESGEWRFVGRLSVGRFFHAATVLPDGRVLVAGGERGNEEPVAAAEVYDPAEQQWTRVGDTPQACQTDPHPPTARLADGSVLQLGCGEQGKQGARYLPSAEGVPPAVTGLVPVAGSTLEETRVTLTGQGLFDPAAGTANVTFGEHAGEVVFASDSRVVARAPAQAQGEVDVTVTTPLGTSPPVAFRYAAGTWRLTERLNACGGCSRRSLHTSTRLADGSVLTVGGSTRLYTGDSALASVERYDPDAGSWNAVASLHERRGYHTATRLEDGSVLAAGGQDNNRDALASTEVFDPDAGDGQGSWEQVGAMATPRYDHTATRLTDGRVLVAGGGPTDESDRETSTDTVEIYDDGSWTKVASMNRPRANHTATLLDDGRVLVTGGLSPDTGGTGLPVLATGAVVLPFAEVYDPRENVWTEVDELAVARFDHTATRLADGRVLVAGGNGGGPAGLASSEVFDPDTGAWTPAGSLAQPRSGHTATRLEDGTVLALGSGPRFSRATRGPVASAELFDPAAGRWRATAWLSGPRGGHTATLLSDGRVLAAGGYTAVEGVADFTFPAAEEVYTPSPHVSGVAPPVGSVDGGETVTLNGRGLGTVSEVRFGEASVGCPSASCDPVAGDQLSVTTPAHPPGPVQVAAVNDGGTSAKLDPDPATVFTFVDEAVGAVTDLVASVVSPSVVALSWTAPDDGSGAPASEYLVRQATTPITTEADFADATVLCADTDGVCEVDPGGSLEVTDLTPGTEYWFAVKPLGRLGQAGPMAVVSVATTDVAPDVVDLAGQALSGTRVELSWPAAAAHGDTGPPVGDYLVKQAREPITDEAAFADAVPLCGSVCELEPGQVGEALSVTVAGLSPQTDYFYAARARDADGTLGPISDTVAVTTPVATPGPVDDLTAQAASAHQVRLAWSATLEDDQWGLPVGTYEIFQSTTPLSAGSVAGAELLCACEFAPADAGEALTATVTDLDGGTEYWYAIRPVNRWGTPGAVSNLATATTAPGPPAAGDPGVDPDVDPASPEDGCPLDEVAAAGFTDRAAIPSAHRGNVDCAAAAAIVAGFADGTYGPARAVRRDQMASFIARTLTAADVDLPQPRDQRFVDVAAGSAHDDAIHRLAAADIVQGGSGGQPADTYGPSHLMRRDQMAAFLLRAAEYATDQSHASHTQRFPDVDEGNVHYPNVNGVAELGLARGFPDGTYGPARSVRRDQMGTFAIRLLNHLLAEQTPA